MPDYEYTKDDAFEFGSKTARAGFENETDIANSINDWETDEDGKWILNQIGVDLGSVDHVSAKTISGHKSDVIVSIVEPCRNLITIGIQVKLVSNERGFNQIDKRWVDTYQNLWDIPEPVVDALKLYTGETEHKEVGSRDARRLFANELKAQDQNLVLEFLWDYKELISKTVFRGDSDFPADWMVIVQNYNEVRKLFVFNIKVVMEFYFNEMPSITPRGNFKFGHVTIQRKGGDRGRNTAKMLQFKIDPIKIVEKTID